MVSLFMSLKGMTTQQTKAHGFSLADAQAFFSVKPVDAIDARWLSTPTKQDKKLSIAKALALIGEMAQLSAQLRIWRAPRMISDHRSIRFDDAAGPPFRQAHLSLQMRDRLALGDGPYHFFVRSSRSAAASSI
jgi:hypothetical protein